MTARKVTHPPDRFLRTIFRLFVLQKQGFPPIFFNENGFQPHTVVGKSPLFATNALAETIIQQIPGQSEACDFSLAY